MCKNNYFDSDEFQNMIKFQQDINMTFPILEWDDIDNNELWDEKRQQEKDVFEKAYKKIKQDKPFGNAFKLPKKDMYKYMKSNIIQNKYWGVDIPVLLGNGDKGTIFIIGESPTRNKKDYKDNGDLIIGTPFAVACEKGAPKQCDIYKYIFNRLINKGYNVYITDAVKVWQNGMKRNEFKGHINKDFLKKEIDNVKPNFVVTWGETAKEAYNRVRDIKIIPQTHPGTQKWDYWEKEMYKDGLTNNHPQATIGFEYANNNEGDRAQYLAYYISEEILQELKKPKAVT